MYFRDEKTKEMLIWHQVSTRTWPGRYHTLFTQISEQIQPKRILSFGCSSGEECKALAEVFPQAIIHGADINPDMLALARARFPQFLFYRPLSVNLQKNGPYDAIFAMNVFHRQTAGAEILPFYTQEYFEKELARLKKNLAKKGHVIVYKAAFSLPRSKAKETKGFDERCQIYS